MIGVTDDELTAIALTFATYPDTVMLNIRGVDVIAFARAVLAYADRVRNGDGAGLPHIRRETGSVGILESPLQSV